MRTNLKIKKLLWLFLISFTFVNCKKEDDNTRNQVPTVDLNNSVNDFTWKAMNSWYNWQESTPDLADSKEDDIDEYYTYLNTFDSPEELYESLKHADDDFSWFIEDYVIQQQSFQGISTTFGIRPSLIRITDTDFVIMYIQHISKGSPADLAGFKRGDLVNGFNGTVMTIDNFESVFNNYFETTTEFNFVENDGITFKENKTITQAVVEDNPIHLTKVFDDINGKKVGYIVYNGFRSSYNDELNDAFGELKSAGINELILDLRINGGGSVLTSAFLASMIYDQVGEETTFGSLDYNSKHFCL